MPREFDEAIEEELRRRRQGGNPVGAIGMNAQETSLFPGGLPWRPGIGTISPQDPSIDTFRQRFAPFSKDPIGDRIMDERAIERRLRGQPIRPGTPERFGDYTKVISGPVPTPDTPSKGLPPGFEYDEPPTAAKGLPPGFAYDPEPEPAPEDPNERAALRTVRGVVGPRKEGEFTRGVEGALPAIGGAIESLGDAAIAAAQYTPLRAASALGQRLIRSATQGGPSEPEAPAGKAAPTLDKPEAYGSTIGRLGQGPQGEFDPSTWTKNYSTLSPRDKTLMFRGDQSNLRFHLDSLDEVAKRVPSWQELGAERVVLGSKFGKDSMLLSAMDGTKGPLDVLSRVASPAAVAQGLARPATAAPIAQWSKAFERIIRSGGGPQAIAAFNLATRNLNNSLGTEIDPETILKGPRDGKPME